jgi:hypothetical protein
MNPPVLIMPAISEPIFTPGVGAHLSVHPNTMDKHFRPARSTAAQALAGHLCEIGVVEAGVGFAGNMQQLHLRAALSAGSSENRELR